MANRQYFNSSAYELDAIARAKWGSMADLVAILDELTNRKTQTARKLAGEVEARLRDLRSGKATASPGPTAGRTYSTGPTAPPGGASAPDVTIHDLRTRLQKADAQTAEAVQQLRNAQAELTRLRKLAVSDAGLFAEVGLHPSAEDFVLKEVQKAYRKRFHPDAHAARPKSEQRASEERLKEAESVFHRIDKVRRKV